MRYYRPPLNKTQKRLVEKLVQKCFLRKFTRGDKSWYVLYDEKVNPLEKIKVETVSKMDRYLDPEIQLFKRDRHGNISLNLSMVRRIDGRNPIKKIYKRRATLNLSGQINVRRKRKINQHYEQESNLLF